MDVGSTKEKMNAFLGDRVICDYLELYPVLTYGLIRMNTMLNMPKERTYERISFLRGYDNYEENHIRTQSAIKRVFFSIYRKAFCMINGTQTKDADEKVMLSQTLTVNSRYSKVLRNFGITSQCITYLCGNYESYFFNRKEILQSVKNFFFRKRTKIQPVFGAESLLPQAYMRACQDWFDGARALAETGKNLSDGFDNMKPYLDKMLFEQRIAIRSIVNILQHNNIRAYITINPYYLSEIVTIMACKDAHIPCRHVEHYVSQFGTFEMAEPYYTNSIYVWNEAEVRFREKNFTYEYMMSPENRQPYTGVSGVLEMDFEGTKRCVHKYKQQRMILFAVPPNYEQSEEGTKYYREWCHIVYAQLHLIKKQTGAKVRIRINPNLINDKQSIIDIELIHFYGFEISKSTAGNLMKDLCECAVIFSAGSSIATVAATLGKQVYQVMSDEFPREIFDSRIRGVEAAEISTLRTLIMDTPPALFASDGFLRADVLTKSECPEDW